MGFGQSIRIYLADGSVTGVRHAEVVNWTGQAIACPRSRVPELNSWDEARRPGIYFLFGFDDAASKPLAYIGEAENVFVRLQNHMTGKDTWNEVILFTSKDENLTKAHVRYLESKLVLLAKSAKRYVIENGNEPQPAALPRGDRDSMDSFLEQIRMLLGVLGHRVLESVAGASVQIPAKSPTDAVHLPTAGLELLLKTKAADARAKLTDEGIAVLAGSKGRAKEQGSMPTSYKALREKLIRAGTVQVTGEWIVFLEDHLFSSPSSAAAVLVGASINGRDAWRNSAGVSLGQLEQIAAGYS